MTPTQKEIKKSIRFSKFVAEAAQQRADEKGLSFSDYVRYLVLQDIEKEGKK